MGKANKLKVGKASRNVPLSQQIVSDNLVTTSSNRKPKKNKQNDEDDSFVDEKLSKKILDVARKQQEELEEEHGASKPKIISTSLGATKSESDDDDESDASDIDDVHYEDVHIDDEDEAAWEQFMSRGTDGQRSRDQRTLADIITEKITEKKTEMQSQFSDAGSVGMAELDGRIVEMYKGVKKILSRYRSGKLPKAFKIIPSLSNWEQVLYLTDPESWSAAAVFQATRIFSSNLKDKLAQRFYNLVLLPRIRDDIAEYKKLNFHLYQALRKSLFKPAAFFKGILLPLCESRTCTLREAVIIGSVISKNSIPVLHSSAAILKIAEMEYSGANSIFLKLLFDKKYALPYRVIDAAVYHYLRFRSDRRELPVLWHQSLLTFVQRYKEDLSKEQKDELMDVMRVHAHPKITAEIRRELINSKCRDEETASEPMSCVVDPSFL